MPVFKFMSLRLRLTLLSVALVGIALAVIGTVLYLYLADSAYQVLDSELRERATQITNSMNSQQVGLGAVNLPETRLDAPQIYVQVFGLDGDLVGTSTNVNSGNSLQVDKQVAAAVVSSQQAVV